MERSSMPMHISQLATCQMLRDRHVSPWPRCWSLACERRKPDLPRGSRVLVKGDRGKHEVSCGEHGMLREQLLCERSEFCVL